VLTDSHGQPRTSSVCWRTATDGLCVLKKQLTWAKITQTVHGKSQRAESKDQPNDVLCLLTDTHGRPVCADGHPRTHTNSHRCPVCADGHPQTSYSPRGPKSPEQSTGKASVLSPRTNVLICVLMDSDGRPVYSDGHTRTAMDVLCVLADTHGRPVCTEQTAHVGQNHPNSPWEEPAC
ncbi:unnamed protein product, partial [Brassica rapa]